MSQDRTNLFAWPRRRYPRGDAKQRYEVRATRKSDGQEIVVGWCNSPDGGVLYLAVGAAGSKFEKPRVIDRRSNETATLASSTACR